VEVTLPADSPKVGTLVRDIQWPLDVVLSCIMRGDRTITPSPEDTLEALDELLFVMAADVDPEALASVLRS